MDVRLAALQRGAKVRGNKLVARLARSSSPILAAIFVPGADRVYGVLRVVGGHLFAGSFVGRRQLRWRSARYVLSQDRARWWGEWGLWTAMSYGRKASKKPSQRTADRIFRRNEEAYWGIER